MYIPPTFEVTDSDEIFDFIESNAFGQLISLNKGGLFSTHMPFLINEERNVIFGHLAKQNPQYQDIEGQEVMITLDGPHDYISPSWYEKGGVPTWNYQTVHIYGISRIINDALAKKEIINSLTEKYEANFDEPWQPEYNESMLDAIVGIEIEITKIQCKYKLSQNRPVQDQRNVAEQLNMRGSKKLAAAMVNEKL